MPNPWDAVISLLCAVGEGTFVTLDDVPNGVAFDVIANVEIGENLNRAVDTFDLRVGIRNVTQSTTLTIVDDSGQLTPDKTPFSERRRVTIAGGWNATTGDVLQAVASYRVTAGVDADVSVAESHPFVVS